MRGRLAIGFVAIGVGVTVTTEALNLAGALNRTGVLVAWAVVAVAGLTQLSKWARTARRAGPSEPAPALAESPWRTANLVLLGSLVVTLTVVALCAPPNTYDSMTYHMGRVVHWLQNESLAPFPTPIWRQLSNPPGAEFAIAQLQLVSGSDRFANLVQTASYAGCVAVVSLVAKRLGAGVEGQLLAAVLAATLPMAVVQSTGTQNDLGPALWLTCLMAFALDRELASAPRALLVGASFGLAAVAKLTGWFYGLPVLAWFLARSARQEGWRRTLTRVLPLVAAAALALNAGQAVRQLSMWRTSGHLDLAAKRVPARSPSEGAPSPAPPVRYTNQSFGPRMIVSNLIRNAGLHLTLPIPLWNDALNKAVRGAHHAIGADANDPTTTYPRGAFRGLGFSMHEDDSGNILHFMLVIAVAGWLLTPRAAGRGDWREYGLVLAAGALVFVCLLKWQPWHSRLHLGLFVLAAPLAAAVLDDRLGRRAVRAVTTLLLVAAIPWLLWNRPRPLAGGEGVLVADRAAQYFANGPKLMEPYRRAADYVRARGHDRVGLMLGGNDWEYPLWVLLGQESGQRSIRLEHLGVENATHAFEASRPPFRPAVVISTTPTRPEVDYGGARYERRASWSPVTVYEEVPVP